RECKKQSIDFSQVLESAILPEICKRFNCATTEDLFAGIGAGDIRLDTVVNKLREEFRGKSEPQALPEIKPGREDSGGSSALLVEGVDGVMVRLAFCCKPLPGDEVVGYTTRGRGVSVHRTDCPNALRYRETEPDRLINVRWGRNTLGDYSAEIEAVCINRERLLMDIMTIMAETKTAVNGVRVSVDKRNKSCSVFIKVEIKSLDQLDYLIQRVRRVRDVLDVYRVINRHNASRTTDK
ncbi:MAG: bifunctional (p)ppGpp synthetase/guanosine-3',5'-bis(diphosphate) 3'-pyrophosphohydrolase, partial [Clostridia bacterium]|nr:bifunctional (p)ppGpp synthetase/guanosine-3',5'-bis(diphosphate) 3'-pyrophosphohydrolase [Clostridia bacterium]